MLFVRDKKKGNERGILINQNAQKGEKKIHEGKRYYDEKGKNSRKK